MMTTTSTATTETHPGTIETHSDTVVTVKPSPSTQHTHTIIFLHGRDSNAADFAAELMESQASDAAQSTLTQLLPGFKWVFPSAGTRHAARFGCEMSQWFDMWSADEPGERAEMQAEGLADSFRRVMEVVEREARLLVGGKGKIVLAGISQGCATAVDVLLKDRAAGYGALVGLSGWMPLGARVGRNGDGYGDVEVLQTRVLLEHCRDDDVVPVRNGESLRDSLVGLGLDVEWHEYEDGGHWVNEPQGIDDLVAFLKSLL
ncbi:Acyl-protein thioesterase 1 [Diplodia seriata]|uniref:Acyl-protein thioesterase 1 n=1 Tax=Diplodia seriata TaxID=420778 RepID=A0A1S8B6L1_9PEZI|nr:Acyl-protein thioesterase 1 [Diplodia seriata]